MASDPPDTLIQDLQRVARHLPYAPRRTDLTDHADHAPEEFINEFGSIEAALEAAEIPTYNVGCSIPLEALLEDVQQVAAIVGQRPRRRDVERHGEYYIDTYLERCGGTWDDVLEAAGFEPTPRSESASREALLEDLERLYEQLTAPPTKPIIDHYGHYSLDRYDEVFDSWDAALHAAEIPEQDYQIPTTELIEELQDLADRLDRTPNGADIADHAAYSATTYRSRFGTLAAAYAAADLEPPAAGDDKPFRHPDN